MQPWKTLTRELVLDERPWLVVERHTVELPDGRRIPNWQWVITPDYVNVVAVTADNTFLCFRQVKYALAGEVLALVGGYVDQGEAPLVAAQRELREETGYEAPDWHDLGSYRVDANRGVAVGHLFLAREARWVVQPHADDLEEQELLHLTRPQLETALQAGEFQVLAWTAAIALALRHV